MAQETKETKSRRLYVYEAIIVILIALILSYVFYDITTGVFEKVKRAEEKINSIQVEMANLRLKISNLEVQLGVKESTPALPEQSAKE